MMLVKHLRNNGMDYGPNPALYQNRMPWKKTSPLIRGKQLSKKTSKGATIMINKKVTAKICHTSEDNKTHPQTPMHQWKEKKAIKESL